MLRKLRPRSAYDVMAALALFLVVTGGTAFAVVAANQVNSQSIINGQVKNADLGANSVSSGKVIENTLTGADVKEPSLGQVPSAANSGKLGGSAASTFQQRVTGSCSTTGGAITAIQGTGGVSCSRAITQVFDIVMNPPAGESRARSFFSPDNLEIRAKCHASGETKILFNNLGTNTAGLSWFSSDGTSVSATGTVLAATTGSQEFDFTSPTRLEGQFIFAGTAAVTTVHLHALDGGSSCAVRGTAVVAPVSS
jgi:hypothetical protein